MEQLENIDELRVPWTIADIFKGIGLLFLTNIIAGGLIFAFNLVLHFNESSLMMILTLVSFVLTILIVWIFSVRKYRSDYRLLGLRIDKSPTQIPAIILAVTAVFIVENLYALILFTVTKMEAPQQEIFDIFGNNLAMAIFVVAILAPVSEELFFRGFVYSALRNKLGVTKAVMLSAAIFSFFHLIPLLFIPLMVIGVALALLYEYKKSLVTPIIMHAFNNLTAVFILYYYGSS